MILKLLSEGTSPHPYHWAKMISEYGEQFQHCPENMSCEKQVCSGFLTRETSRPSEMKKGLLTLHTIWAWAI